MALFVMIGEYTGELSQDLLDAHIAWKTHEVAKFTSLTGHQYADVVLCLSDTFFQRLPKDVLALLVETANDLVSDHRRRMTDIDTAASGALKAAGVMVTDVSDKMPFQNAVASIYEDIGKRLNILDMINEVRSM